MQTSIFKSIDIYKFTAVQTQSSSWFIRQQTFIENFDCAKHTLGFMNINDKTHMHI